VLCPGATLKRRKLALGFDFRLLRRSLGVYFAASVLAATRV